MYSIGLDYGSESCRAALLDLKTKQITAVVEQTYEHGIITENLYNVKIKNNKVLQNPNDYLDCMESLITLLLEQQKLPSTSIKSIGIDFTSCTVLPVDESFNPICNQLEYKERPHAYAKLWKSHSAYKEAEHITNILSNHPYLKKYGGTISSEWLLPKLLELKNEDMQIFEECKYFMEAGDWLVSKLTGSLVRSSCQAGFKGLWQSEDGYLKPEVLSLIDDSFTNIYKTKLAGKPMLAGEYAGNLTPEMAEKLGLHTDVVVAVSIIDAHSALVGAGVSRSNEMLIVMGTSSCHMLLSNEEKMIPGVSGVVKDGIFKDLFAYEAGQVAVGDIFSYFIREQLPTRYIEEAKKKDCSVFEILNSYAGRQSTGSHGLVVLDWHNGNRTPYVNPNLTAVMVGETLQTKAYEKYRALLESTAFGTKQIVELFIENGLAIDKIILAGGIPKKTLY